MVYDIKVVDGGEGVPITSGTLNVTADVTRAIS
jgi:hypothetical protein